VVDCPDSAAIWQWGGLANYWRVLRDSGPTNLYSVSAPTAFFVAVLEILREVADAPIVLGTVLAGQFVGEMGFIEKRLRNATARASTEVTAEEFSAEEFFQRVSADPAMVHELMLRLSGLVSHCRRLRL
jgi:hypothetical protein